MGQAYICRRGGGKAKPPIPKDVNFYDYDGTLIAGYTVEEAQALTSLPKAPDRTGDRLPVAFQRWTHTLEQVNATTGPLDIGACRISADGKTRVLIRALTANRSVTFQLSKDSTAELSIDYGDSTTDTAGTGTTTVKKSHTYGPAGEYIVTIWRSGGTGKYDIGVYGASSQADGRLISTYDAIAVVIGQNVERIAYNGLRGNTSMLHIAVPYGVKEINEYALAHLRSTRCLILPPSIDTLDQYACYGNNALGVLVLPNTEAMTTLPAASFTVFESGTDGNRSLSRLIIPPNITTIQSGAFSSRRFVDLYCYRATPPVLGSTETFQMEPRGRIHVPAASVSAYKSATNWSIFASHIVGDL